MNHQQGLDAARQLAEWYLGSPEWADILITAYYNPNKTLKELKLEKEA